MISLRAFAYLRVSTADQTTDNQHHEIVGAGFHIEPHRVTAETISGSVAAVERQGFKKLIDRMEAGDVLRQPPISGHLIDADFAHHQSMRPNLHVHHRHRRNRRVLAMTQ